MRSKYRIGEKVMITKSALYPNSSWLMGVIMKIHEIKNNFKATQYSYGDYIITITEQIETGGTQLAECYVNIANDAIVRHVVGVVKQDNWLECLLNAAVEYIEMLNNKEME